ncbi:MAG: amino acid ABC transporter permease [Bacillota bacterium]
MNWQVVWESRTVLLGGALVTLELSALAIGLGTTLGLIIALIRTARVPVLSQIARVYIEIFRGSPLLMQLFFVFFGLPYLGFDISKLAAAVWALTLYSGAYIAEIIRAGIEAVPKGQREAAHSLGLSSYEVMRHVVLPQTLTVALPPLIGFYIGLVKDTSLATIIGYRELIRESQSIIDRTARPLEVYTAVALIYFAICYPLSLLVTRLERRVPAR